MLKSDIVEGAITEILKPYGWRQHALGAHTLKEGSVCAIGAMYRTLESVNDQARDTVYHIDHDFNKLHGNSIANINDMLETTPQLMADLLTGLAKQYRNKGE